MCISLVRIGTDRVEGQHTPVLNVVEDGCPEFCLNPDLPRKVYGRLPYHVNVRLKVKAPKPSHNNVVVHRTA